MPRGTRGSGHGYARSTGVDGCSSRSLQCIWDCWLRPCAIDLPGSPWGSVLGAIPFLTNLTGYYYGFLLEYATLWVVSPLSALALAVTSAATCAVPIVLRNDDDRSMMISLLIGVYALGATVSTILQRRRFVREARGAELVTSSKDYAVARSSSGAS
jgi:hypothetical protein